MSGGDPKVQPDEWKRPFAGKMALGNGKLTTDIRAAYSIQPLRYSRRRKLLALGLLVILRLAASHSMRLLPKLKLEIAVNEAFVEACVEAIVRGARTGERGKVGDGKIFVLPMEDCVQIRTGETGVLAIGP
jgi:hypothetical protein